MAPAMDIDHLRGWIGRTHQAEDVVTPRLVAQFGATFLPQVFAVPEGEAPAGLHWCLAPPAEPMADLAADGHAAKGGFLPPIPLPRRMWAGGAVETVAPLRLGDAVTRRSTVEDVSMKRGRTGPLVFVAVRHEVSTPRGLALRERHDIVYREAPTPGAAAAPAATPAGPRASDLAWAVEGSPVLLFRYSALTFNGHRIHYDLPYVTAVEGYAGLLVHGPIQATLCFNLAAELLGRVPRRFAFRNTMPLVAGPAFRVAGRRAAEGGVACWTEGADGAVRMEAEAAG